MWVHLFIWGYISPTVNGQLTHCVIHHRKTILGNHHFAISSHHHFRLEWWQSSVKLPERKESWNSIVFISTNIAFCTESNRVGILGFSKLKRGEIISFEMSHSKWLSSFQRIFVSHHMPDIRGVEGRGGEKWTCSFHCHRACHLIREAK